MKRLILVVLALSVLGSVLPSTSLGQKATKNKAVPGTPPEYAKLRQLRDVVGRLSYVDSSTKLLAINIDYQYPIANANYNRNNKRRSYPRTYRPNYRNGSIRASVNNTARLEREWLSIVRQEQQAMMIRNPVQRARRLQQVAMETQRLQAQMMMNQARTIANVQRMEMQAMMNQARVVGAANRQLMQNMRNNPPFKLATASKQFELEGTPKVVVRRLKLPFEYDDKGNPKTYTSGEIKALKGKDTSLPGYTAQYEDLQVGQIVKLYLVPPAKTTRDPTVVDQGDDGRPPVRMVVILADSDGSTTPVLLKGAAKPRAKKK